MPQFFIFDIPGHQLLHDFLYEGQMRKFVMNFRYVTDDTSGFEVA